MVDFDKLGALIEATVGKNDTASQVTQFIDTGFPPLNAAISGRYDGGLPMGRIVEIFGPESSGKTAIATAAMADAQKKGGIAVFFDHERSFQESLGVANGLSIERGKWVYKKPKSYEAAVDAMMNLVATIRENKIIKKTDPIVVVFDSLASMIPESMLGKDTAKLNMNDSSALARVTSNTMKIIAAIAEEHNVLVIFLNQIREKIGVMFGDPTTTPGGKAPKFYASVRIQLGASPIKTGSGDDTVIHGSEVTAVCRKNKINRPFLRSKWKFMFKNDGSGYFDKIGSTLDFMIKNDMIPASGRGYYVWEGNRLSRKDLAEYIEKNGGIAVLETALLKSATVTEEDEDAKAAGDEDARREAAMGLLESDD